MEVEEYWTDRLVAVITYSNYGEQNVITPPGQAAPAPPPEPTTTPTPGPTAEAIVESVDTWLEPNPETVPPGSAWNGYTLRGSGITRVDIRINVINYPNGPRQFTSRTFTLPRQ